MSSEKTYTPAVKRSFNEAWAFEEQIKMKYPPGSRVSYENPRKSKTGKPMADWVVKNADGEKLAVHTMLVLVSQRTGEKYAVVSRDAQREPPPPPSQELRDLLASLV